MTDGLRRTTELGGSVTAVFVVLTLGVWHGVHKEAVSVEVQGFVVDIAVRGAVPAVLGFSTLVAVSGLVLFWEISRSKDREERLLDGPQVAAVVPAYEDAAVLEESVGSLLASNYENLRVVIAVEPSDRPTVEAARSLARHPDVEVLVNRQPGSKARAINDAVERIDAEYFALFDADERVDPDFVPTAMHDLVEGDRDVFQARRVPRVNGAVEAVAYLDWVLFNAGYTLVEPLGFKCTRSASVAFTREAVEAVGGYSDVTTEDTDFAHKCFRHGLDVRTCRSLANEVEAPHTLRDLWRQRRRWRLGHLEVALKALAGEFETDGSLRDHVSTARLCLELLTSVALVALIAKIAVLLYLGEPGLAALPVVAVAVAVAPIVYNDVRDGYVRELSPALLCAPLIYPWFGLVTIRACFEYVLTWEGEWYAVEKTGA